MLKLILGNVYRHRLLYALIGLVVAMLSFYLVIGLNASFSSSDSLERAIAENMAGDLIIASPAVRSIDLIGRRGELAVIPLEDWQGLLSYVRGKSYVAVAAPRLRVPAEFRSVDNVLSGTLVGVDPAVESTLLPRRILDEGAWITGPGQINLYYRHADYLSARVGDTLGATVTTKDGYRRFETMKLVGNLDYKDIDYYSEFAYHGFVDLGFLNSLLMNNSPEASEILVRMGPGGSPARLEKDIARDIGRRLTYILPRDSSRLVGGIYRLTRFIVLFVVCILFAMAYLCCSFIVNLSIQSRSREIGIYEAIGVPRWRIGLLFSGEFLIVMAVFALVGSGLAAVFMRRLSRQGIEATIVPLHLVFGRSVLHIVNDPRSYLLAFLAILAAFAGNALAAGIRMGRMQQAEVGRDL